MAFSFRAGTNWCHDFPKLARESGFYFNMHGSRVRVDWNRISAIDIDRVIHERDFWTIDENINNVIDYCLENEYDTKILDPNFVKLFRLAQLSVEYLLYCKQYLDHSVIILKDELRQKIEQTVSMKKEIATLEDTIKNLKEKSKEKRKLIETNVSEISNGEIYKCPHCPKTFVRAIFVNAHIARKHSYISDMGVTVSPVHEHYRAETEKLHNEIKTLKERLNQTERVIRNESDRLDNTEKRYLKNTSQTESDISKLGRFEEQRRYQEDIGSLRNILFDEIRALREKDHNLNESILETNVKSLIRQQEKEIESLRNQLLERLTPGMENMQMKLQTQENYWKAKIEDMQAQHNNDIERLTTELKATQQITDRIKSEYAIKVHDLEKQSMDQSNILVEQRKQLNSLSREISNTQPQIITHRIKGKNWEEVRESPLLKIKLDSEYNNSEIYQRKSSIDMKNTEMTIEDVDNESSQDYSDKLPTNDDKYDIVKSKDNRKYIVDFNRAREHVFERSNLKNLVKLESQLVGKADKAKRYDTLADMSEIHDRTNDSSFTTNENVLYRENNKHTNIRSTEKKRMTSHDIDDVKNNKTSKLLNKYTESSMTETESLSSMSESESDSESVTADDDVTVVKQPPETIRKLSIQEDTRSMFDNRLRELGIDPEWRGIPTVTYKQKMEIVRHQRNVNAKTLSQYVQLKRKILEDVLRKISADCKESKCNTLTKNSPSSKLITHVRSKTAKGFNHEDNNIYKTAQKAQNTTPSKLRLRQKIELLPRKYKDNEVIDSTSRESSLRTNEGQADDLVSPKVSLAQSRLIRNISSPSSIGSQEDVVKTQILSTKIIVSDSNARKTSSPINRKLVTVSKFSDNDSNTNIVQQDESLVSLKHNKGVLKPTSGSDGSLMKKKVLFDLDDENMAVLENDQRKGQIYSNFDSLSFPERREYTLQKEKSMSTSNIVLKTSQSDKIAEISKKIQEQLSIARKPPVGSVETIFRSTSNFQDLTNYNLSNQPVNSNIAETTTHKLTSPKTSDNAFPQPAPRTLKDKNITSRENKLKYSDLDSDIDEILRIE